MFMLINFNGIERTEWITVTKYIFSLIGYYYCGTNYYILLPL